MCGFLFKDKIFPRIFYVYVLYLSVYKFRLLEMELLTRVDKIVIITVKRYNSTKIKVFEIYV